MTRRIATLKYIIKLYLHANIMKKFNGLALFKRLCRYYFYIDPAATAEYICIYRDLYDNNDDEEIRENNIKHT